ncbi:MAG: A/G-specific adenine glycosylase [Hyphomonas sp.]|uniref:A/G-specific adenine glycosylase n=1 Tax=Hyphomonas sp. TaxID=87 RepID=UPI003527A4DA
MPKHGDLNAVPAFLLDWFDRHGRDLPWRLGKGRRRDPYRVWLAEIMLQQTTIPHGTPYFLKFTERWPTVDALAAAPDEEVMAAWAGLGYYARARNLLKCAREIASHGSWPETAADLRKLPGIGPYTAGAIAAIAFDQREAAVDGNVDRVFARLLALKEDWASAKKRIHAEVSALVPAKRPGDFAEALMDLGATVCTPTRPNCLICPLSKLCMARAEKSPEAYPLKPAKAPKPLRTGTAWVIVHKGHVLLVRRPHKGLLGGMLALPSSEWREGSPDHADEPAGLDWMECGEVRHVFTHFTLHLAVRRADVSRRPAGPDGQWVPLEEVDGLPSVFAKAFRLGTGRSKG